MIITFASAHPPKGIIAREDLVTNIGKEVDLINLEGTPIAKAKILDIMITADGIEITYETDLRLELTFNLERTPRGFD